MPSKRRDYLRRILADHRLRRELMVSTIQATQAREGVETTPEQAREAYDRVRAEKRTEVES